MLIGVFWSMPTACSNGSRLMFCTNVKCAPATAFLYDWNMLPIGQQLWLKELQSDDARGRLGPSRCSFDPCRTSPASVLRIIVPSIDSSFNALPNAYAFCCRLRQHAWPSVSSRHFGELNLPTGERLEFETYLFSPPKGKTMRERL
jgi:hypothetical protein